MNILIPDSWLREYLETDATPEQIKDCLSLCGPSVERVNKVGNDYIYEIEISSNRIDMASVYGIAREASAILPRFGIKAKLKKLQLTIPVKPQTILPMDVSDPSKICDRIMGIVMEVESMKDPPGFMKERLKKSGVRSLNNLVDITNYVMLELGHPAHVFDYDRIKTHKFIIRFAKKNESIITLDEKKYLLSMKDVIIDDGTNRVIDLPGIMGTENSVVTNKTRRIFFFIESNNPVLIRKTSMRYAIRTMAATINEKHPDPELVKVVMLRGIELYQEIAGAKVIGNIIDIYPNPPKPITIITTTQFISERLGVELKTKEIIDILKSLSFEIETSVIPSKQSESRNLSIRLNSHSREIPRQVRDDTLIVTPPSFRQFDIIIPEDIVEEVARIYGYHNLPSRLMTGEIPVTDKPKILELEEKIKQILKYFGYTEIYNYSFISKDLIKKGVLSISDHLKVANPLTNEIEYMRISLIPSMLETITKNQYYSDNLRLFELAKVYEPQKKSLPNEISVLTISNQKDFYQLKGIVETLLKELGIQNVILNAVKNHLHNLEFVRNPSSAKWDQDDALHHFWHPLQTVSLIKKGKNLGFIGRISPTLCQNFQIINNLFLAVLNVELLTELANPSKRYIPMPLYPAVIEDITLTYPPQTYIGPIISAIYNVSNLVKNVVIVGRFHNSITLRITYQDEKRNLESQEIKKIRNQVLYHLKSTFKAFLKQ